MPRNNSPHYVVYRLWLDGVVRYVGEGWYTRPYEHRVVVAARLAGRGPRNLTPKLYDALCVAMAAGTVLEEEVIIWGLTKDEARTAEKLEIARWPEDQLLNETRGEREVRIQKLSDRNKTDLEWRAKHREAMVRLHADPEFRKKNQESARRLNDNPELRANRLKQLVQLHADPEYRARLGSHLAALHKRNRSDPDHGARVSAGKRAAKERRLREQS